MEYYVYSDESYISAERYRSIGAVSFPRSFEKEIKMLHSYTVPEIIAVKIDNGSKAYLDWIKENTESNK